MFITLHVPVVASYRIRTRSMEIGLAASKTRQSLEVNGYEILRSFLPNDFTTYPIYECGKHVKIYPHTTLHQLMPPSGVASAPNTYSGRYGFNEFPLHTDLAQRPLPPRYVLLRCQKGFDHVKTFLVDGFSVLDEIGRSAAFRALLRPRRPTGNSVPLLRLLSRIELSINCLRWDETYLRPASTAGEQGYALFSKAISDWPREEVSLAKPGDTLVIDNWRMLHGRSHVPSGCESRLLQRAYLEDIQ
jgi:L-asparagine oxygenase